jgi:hypothetical protein
MWTVRTEIQLRHEVKYGVLHTAFHETRKKLGTVLGTFVVVADVRQIKTNFVRARQ